MADLVKTEDLTKFDDGDPEFFVRAAEREVRKYCGWHIAPSVDVLDGRYQAGERGLIVLPSLHVTAVKSVTVCGKELDRSEYSWEECGVIHRLTTAWPILSAGGGYLDDFGNYYGDYEGFYGLYGGHPAAPIVQVSFTHGYAETPPDVAAVVFEMASQGVELPSASATDIQAGPFRAKLKAGEALTLTRGQKNRLASYRLPGVA